MSSLNSVFEYASATESLRSSSSTEFGSACTDPGCDSPPPNYILSPHIARPHWEADTTSDEDDRTDYEIFQSLRKKWGDFFQDNDDLLEVGEKIAEGSQAEIFTTELTDYAGRKREFVLKVFKEGCPLRELKKQWPRGMLQRSKVCEGMYFYYNSCLIYGGLLLKNGRFAFWMARYWGDLRKLIDIRMQHNRNQSPPFTHYEARRIMYSIAQGMQQLHEDKIIHKDLKASNILVQVEDNSTFDPIVDGFRCLVADFECSVGVVGTGYWRAPEILRGVQTREIEPHLFTEQSDVFSFAMTCYEVLTGCIPFKNLRSLTCYDIVIRGQRPTLPAYIHPSLDALLGKCWHVDPSQRPSFAYIVYELESIVLYEGFI